MFYKFLGTRLECFAYGPYSPRYDQWNLVIEVDENGDRQRFDLDTTNMEDLIADVRSRPNGV